MNPKFNHAVFVITHICIVAGFFVESASAQDRNPIRLTHGPMLGHVTANSVRVWGRTSDPGQFMVKFGIDADKQSQTSQPTTTRIEDDNTGFLELTGLKPDTRYYYQIWTNDRPHGLPGSFRTLPSSELSKNAEYNPKGLFNFRFEIGSCANQNPLHGMGHRAPVYEHLNRDWADKVHFHIMNGDWLYEELRRHPPEAWRLTQGVDQTLWQARFILVFKLIEVGVILRATVFHTNKIYRFAFT